MAAASPATVDLHYPATTIYEGPLGSTGRHPELEGTPLDAYASAYHHGRSDLEAPPAPSEAEPAGGESITTRITSIFKKKTHEDEYPQIGGEPYRGPVDETWRRNELEGEPLDQRVSRYHPGFYEEVGASQYFLLEIETLFYKFINCY